ncbi:hypothetical protein U1Q18_038115, partial [Sarracenia purpurea var. burkii]
EKWFLYELMRTTVREEGEKSVQTVISDAGVEIGKERLWPQEQHPFFSFCRKNGLEQV